MPDNISVVSFSDLQEEVAFWRREAIARLQMAIALHASYVKRDDDRSAADTRLDMIANLAALEAADAKEWHDRCCLCGEFIRPEQPRATLTLGDPDDDDIDSAHASCAGVEGMIWIDNPDEIIARARAVAIPQETEQEEHEHAR